MTLNKCPQQYIVYNIRAHCGLYDLQSTYYARTLFHYSYHTAKKIMNRFNSNRQLVIKTHFEISQSNVKSQLLTAIVRIIVSTPLIFNFMAMRINNKTKYQNGN